MSESIGPQAFGANEEHLFLGREVTRSQDYSEETARRIDAEVHRLVTDAYAEATQIIKDNSEKLELIANRLLEAETIDGYEVEEIVEHGRLLTDAERDALKPKVDAESPASEANSDGTAAEDVAVASAETPSSTTPPPMEPAPEPS